MESVSKLPNETEAQDYYYPQELVLQLQQDRQYQPLSEQAEHFAAWRAQEQHLVNKLVIAETFNSQTQHFPNWEFAKFYPGSLEGDSSAEIVGNWSPAHFHNTAGGLQLRSIIIRSVPQVTLRSLGCELKMGIRLSGQSTFWIITRGVSVSDPDAVICKIRKEQDCQRVFLIFGAPVGPSNEFKFFRKQEIPEIPLNSEEALAQDYTDIRLTFTDNGDDRVFAAGHVNSSTAREIRMSCNKFVPTLRNSRVMLAGSGDSVNLKNVSVKQVERLQGQRASVQRHHECCRLM